MLPIAKNNNFFQLDKKLYSMIKDHSFLSPAKQMNTSPESSLIEPVSGDVFEKLLLRLNINTKHFSEIYNTAAQGQIISSYANDFINPVGSISKESIQFLEKNLLTLIQLTKLRGKEGQAGKIDRRDFFNRLICTCFERDTTSFEETLQASAYRKSLSQSMNGINDFLQSCEQKGISTARNLASYPDACDLYERLVKNPAAIKKIDLSHIFNKRSAIFTVLEAVDLTLEAYSKKKGLARSFFLTTAEIITQLTKWRRDYKKNPLYRFPIWELCHLVHEHIPQAKKTLSDRLIGTLHTFLDKDPSVLQLGGTMRYLPCLTDFQSENEEGRQRIATAVAEQLKRVSPLKRTEVSHIIGTGICITFSSWQQPTKEDPILIEAILNYAMKSEQMVTRNAACVTLGKKILPGSPLLQEAINCLSIAFKSDPERINVPERAFHALCQIGSNLKNKDTIGDIINTLTENLPNEKFSYNPQNCPKGREALFKLKQIHESLPNSSHSHSLYRR